MHLLNYVIAVILASGCMLGTKAQAAPASRLEYAKQCAAEMGAIPTGFNCLNGVVIPITKNNIPQNQPVTDCDKPIQLGGPDTPCVPFARLLRLNTGVSSVETIVICRKYHASSGPNDPIFHDIAMIQHNKATGNTCYYQSPPDEPRDGSNVPSPQEDSPVANNMWLEPGATGPHIPGGNDIKCTNCHDADAFVWSPYVVQVADVSKWNPKGLWNSNFLGAFGSPIKTFEPDANACTTCHRIGSNTCHFGGAIGIHEYADKGWMPLGSSFGPEHTNALLQLDRCCGDPNLPECKTKEGGVPPDTDKDGIIDKLDNCPLVANPDQTDTDFDGHGDACDDDDDDDGCKDAEDQHPKQNKVKIGTYTSATCNPRSGPVFGSENEDSDNDGLLNCKDTDDDNDGILDDEDPCSTVKGKCPLIIKDCPVQVPWDVCRGGGCVEFFLKLVYAINPPTVTPQIDVAIFNRFWIEDRAIYIPASKEVRQPNAYQAIIRQLSTVPALTTAGRLRLEIWSRAANGSAGKLRAVVAEYDSSQVVMAEQNIRGSTIRLLPPQAPGGEFLVEVTDKTEPVKDDKSAETNNLTYLWAILILAVIAIVTVIAVKKK